MNKKATIKEIGYAMIIIFLAATVFLVVKYSYTQVVDIMTNQTVFNESQAAVTALDQTKELTNRFDYILFALLMGFTIAILIAGWFSSGHPLFIFIYFIAIVLLVAVSAILSFVWEKITDTAILSSTADSFPIMNLILDNFPVYITIVAFVGMMMVFAKPKFTQ